MQLFFFSKVRSAGYNIVNGIKLGSDPKKTDKHAVGRKVIYVRCINCSYNNVAKGIRLLDKKNNIFCLYRNNVMKVTAFERYIPLKLRISQTCQIILAKTYKFFTKSITLLLKLSAVAKMLCICRFYFISIAAV